MTKPILVTGGTGTLGRAVVRRLVDHGHHVRLLSRRPEPTGEDYPYEWSVGDLATAGGIDDAVDGVGTVVHCATAPRGDVDAARNLVAACRRAAVSHLVYISIVGVDRIEFGYYRAKLEAERVIEGSRVPYTILRATQFHDLVASTARVLSKLPVVLVPAGMSVQPVDAREVADRLAELAGGAPAGRVPDLGGPQVRTATDLVRAYIRAGGRHRPLLPVRLPGAAAAGFRRGGNLAPDRAVGRVTFEEYLAERFAAGSRPGTNAGGR